MIGLFIVELAAIFLISRALINSLSRFLSILTGSRSAAVYILAILFLPGTILHELAHLLTAGMLFVPVGELEVVPEIREDGVKLGSVQIGQTDPLRRLLVGAAPLVVGLGVILSVFAFTPSIFAGSTPLWMTAGIIYLIFTITNTMFSSKKDLEGAASFLGALVIIILLLFLALRLTGHTLSLDWFNQLSFSGLNSFLQKADLQLLIPFSVDLLLISLMKVFSLGRV